MYNMIWRALVGTYSGIFHTFTTTPAIYKCLIPAKFLEKNKIFFFFEVLLCLTTRSDLLVYLLLLFLNGKAIPYSRIFFSPFTRILLRPPLANPRIASSFSASDEVGSWEFGLLQASLHCRTFIERRLRLAGLYLVSPSFIVSRGIKWLFHY